MIPTCVLRKATLLVVRVLEQDIVALQPKTVHQLATGAAESGNMKIKEIIVEGRNGEKPAYYTSDTGQVKFRDKGGYDRTYHLNRIMMATAMADGKSKKAVDMDSYSWVEKYNTQHPYTEEEYNMFRQAEATVPTDSKEVLPWSKSAEPDDTHKTSPISNWNKK